MRGDFPPESNNVCLPWLLSPYFFYDHNPQGLTVLLVFCTNNIRKVNIFIWDLAERVQNYIFYSPVGTRRVKVRKMLTHGIMTVVTRKIFTFWGTGFKIFFIIFGILDIAFFYSLGNKQWGSPNCIQLLKGKYLFFVPNMHVCMFACLHVCMFACVHVFMFAKCSQDYTVHSMFHLGISTDLIDWWN